jgi:hypothetical protein
MTVVSVRPLRRRFHRYSVNNRYNPDNCASRGAMGDRAPVVAVWIAEMRAVVIRGDVRVLARRPFACAAAR